MTMASTHSWVQRIMRPLVIMADTNFKAMLSFNGSYILRHHKMFATIFIEPMSITTLTMSFGPWHSSIKCFIKLAFNRSLMCLNLCNILGKVIAYNIVARLGRRTHNIWNLRTITILHTWNFKLVHRQDWHWSNIRITVNNLILDVVVRGILIYVSCI